MSKEKRKRKKGQSPRAQVNQIEREKLTEARLDAIERIQLEEWRKKEVSGVAFWILSDDGRVNIELKAGASAKKLTGVVLLIVGVVVAISSHPQDLQVLFDALRFMVQ